VPALVDLLVDRRPDGGPYLIGITGGVSVGKSTMAAAVAAELAAHLGVTITVLGSDAFLWNNAELESRGLSMEKGFPDSYDVVSLRAAMGALAQGRGVAVPSYSHRTYDIETGVTDRIEAADIVIVEGLHLIRFAGDLLHTSVHLHATAEVMEEWYVARMASLVTAAVDDPDSFYRAFVGLDDATVDAIARDFWTSINLVNLRDHIDPTRDDADLLVLLDDHHRIVQIVERSRPHAF
jgi:type I pantothenate kinase